jgi:hypothetical protein
MAKLTPDPDHRENDFHDRHQHKENTMNVTDSNGHGALRANLQQLAAASTRPFALGALLLTSVFVGLAAPMYSAPIAEVIGYAGRVAVVLALVMVGRRIVRGDRSPIPALLWLAASQLVSAAGAVVAEPDRSVAPLLAAMITAFVAAFSARAKNVMTTRVLLGVSVFSWAWAISPRADIPGAVLAAAGLAAPALVMVTRELRRANRPWLLAGVAAVFGWVGAIASVGRAMAVAQDVSQDIAVAAVVAGIVAGIVALAVSGISLVFARSAIAGVLAVVIGATGAVATGAVVDTAPGQELVVLAPLAQNAPGASKMTADEGAGPEEQFRGFSFDQCDQLNDRDCFITHYDDIAIRMGLRTAVTDISQRVKNNEGANFPAHCHQVVHNLGQIAIELTNDFATVAAIDPQVCGTGFTHGLWELTFEQIGDEAIFTGTGKLCSELNMVTDWYRWSCHHILGHMLTTKMMDNPAKAMEYCNEVSTRNITDCLAGGWMGYFQDDYVLAAITERGTPQDLFNTCYGAESGYNKYFCYQEIFPALYKLLPADADAGKACLELSEAPAGVGEPWEAEAMDFATRCVMGLSRAIAVSSDYDYRAIGPRCLTMPLDAQAACLTAAAASIVLNTGSATGGIEVCKRVVDDRWRGYCYYWTRHSHDLLADGPNSENMPTYGEIRLPGAAVGKASTKDDSGK